MKKSFLPEEYQSSIHHVLISEQEIQAAVRKTGEQISRTYEGKPLLLVSILKGSFVFLADLCRAVRIPCEIGFMGAKSYTGTVSSGKVEITLDLEQDIRAYHVLIVEDIVDTGITLQQVVKMLKERHPLSLRVISLLDKPKRRIVDWHPDQALFSIPDVFVIGYGLDCEEQYRNLPYIAVYEESSEKSALS